MVWVWFNQKSSWIISNLKSLVIKPVDDEGRMALFLDDERVPDEELEMALERYMRPIEADESECWSGVWEDIKAYYKTMLKLITSERVALYRYMSQLPEEQKIS